MKLLERVQQAMQIEEIIEHYGTKGMKWGVRKSKVPKHGPSDDAKQAHRALVKAKVSGPEALTNKEIKSLNDRLNLEQQYDRLSYSPSTAKRVLDAVFKTGKQVNDAVAFANSPAGKALQSSLSTTKAGPAPKHLKKP